jgi:hypothetical protein
MAEVLRAAGGIRVRVEYTAPGSWEPASAELLPVVWRRPDGRWIWAACGWAMDDPGDIVDAPPEQPPAPGLPYQVRTISLGSRDGEVWGSDYNGSHPVWRSTAWCATRSEADLVAAAQVRWRHAAHRAQVWGPGDTPDDRRRRLASWSAPEDRAAGQGMPYRQRPPGQRPDGPPPAIPPTAAAEGPDVHLRVWSPPTGWTTAGWYTSRQAAAVTAWRLQVGAPGAQWHWGDIWGPDRHGPGRNLLDLLPDPGPEEYLPEG